MTGLLAVAAALGGVLLVTAVLVLAGGWRPGGRSRPTAGSVQERARRDLALPPADWRTVRRAVERGQAAPERLRPAAHELATRMLAQQRTGFAFRRPWLAAALIAGYVLVVAAVLALVRDASAGRLAINAVQLLVPVGLLLWVLRLQHRRLRAAVELNLPGAPTASGG